jgi:hypothetical protein
LWEEAMRHFTWVQNRSPAQALNRKTPYKMKHKRKPHLDGIREFGVAAYVKDLRARKLDPRAQVGCFVGYDSESKGYRIYWPAKRTVTVERNVVFSEDDVRMNENLTVIPGDPLAEGEKEKVIQQSPNTPKSTEEPEDEAVSKLETEHKPSKTHQETLQLNSIPFPSTPVKTTNTNPETEESQPETCGHGENHKAPTKQCMTALLQL